MRGTVMLNDEQKNYFNICCIVKFVQMMMGVDDKVLENLRRPSCAEKKIHQRGPPNS